MVAVGPLAQEGLNEAFGLTVSSRRLGFGAEMANGRSATRRCEHVSAVAGAVVGEDTLDFDTALLEPGDGAAEESSGSFAALVRQNLNVSDSRMIVDADVNEVIAEAALLPSSIAGDPVTDAVDACKLLNVEMEQSSGFSVLVAHHSRWRSVEGSQASKTCGFDDSSDGRSTASNMASDLAAGQPRVGNSYH